jgi:hypothetical protein
MQLQPRAQHPDPELWRAVHDAPLASLSRHEVEVGGRSAPLHGMPADRLAMAASRLLPDAPRGVRLG